MKINLTVELDEEDLRAIAADLIDYKRKKPAPATKSKAEKWLLEMIRVNLCGTVETYHQGGIL